MVPGIDIDIFDTRVARLCSGIGEGDVEPAIFGVDLRHQRVPS
jgi:hypothetical protein